MTEITHEFPLPRRDTRGLLPCPVPQPVRKGTCPVCGGTGVPVTVRWHDPAHPASELDLGALRALVESYQPCADTAACFDRLRAPRPKAIEAPKRRPSQAWKTLLGAARKTGAS